jgi:hypothetical protein
MNFTLFPIIFLGSFQCIVAVLLLAPLPVARIAINICKATTTPVGQTFLGTISVFLLVLLVPPVRYTRLAEVVSEKPEPLWGIMYLAALHTMQITSQICRAGACMSGRGAIANPEHYAKISLLSASERETEEAIV